MRYISKVRKKKFNERISFDKILQLWFNYHFFFFQSLIFRGLKLRAFSLFVAVKAGLKTYDFLAVIDKSKKKEKEEDEEKKKALLNFLAKIFSYDDFLLKVEEEINEEDPFFSAKKCSFSYVWIFFQFFFIKNLNKFFFSKFFSKLFFIKHNFLLYDIDFFFFSFLKKFFVIWFFLKKVIFFNFNLKVYNYKFSFFLKKKKTCLKLSYIYFFKRAYKKFIFQFFFFFKQLTFFNQNYFRVFEKEWRLVNNETLDSLGVFRKVKFWNSFFSFFFKFWLKQAKNLKKDFLEQDFNIAKKPVFDPSFVFFLALLKITPVLVLKPIPMGSVNYDMPFPITYWKRISYASRWIINLLKKKSRVISVEGVVSLIIGTLFDEGFSIEKKNEVYFLVNLNRHLLRHKLMRR